MWVRNQGNHPTKHQVLRTGNPENSPHLSLSSPQPLFQFRIVTHYPGTDFKFHQSILHSAIRIFFLNKCQSVYGLTTQNYLKASAGLHKCPCLHIWTPSYPSVPQLQSRTTCSGCMVNLHLHAEHPHTSPFRQSLWSTPWGPSGPDPSTISWATRRLSQLSLFGDPIYNNGIYRIFTYCAK